MAEFHPTTPPGTPERQQEVHEWARCELQACSDRLLLHLRDVADEARRFHEGIELIEEAFAATQGDAPC